MINGRGYESDYSSCSDISFNVLLMSYYDLVTERLVINVLLMKEFQVGVRVLSMAVPKPSIYLFLKVT